MKYTFKCKKCDKLYAINMSMKEYHEDGLFCSECKGELIRDMADYCASNQWKCDGAYGKVSN